VVAGLSLISVNSHFIFMNAMLAGIFGGWEIILILAVVLILFGAKKLPELAKGLGTGIKEFKKATREVTDEIQNAGTETPALPPKAPPVNTTAQSTPPETKVV
jgi:sec-independent protein translocase protein TatA